MIEELRMLLSDIWNAIEHHPGFWTVFGIILGIFFGEGIRFAHWRWRISQFRKRLRKELEANLALIVSRHEKIEKMLSKLRDGQIPSGHGLPAFTMIYDCNKTTLVQALSSDQLGALHMIYEPLKQYDRIISNLDTRLTNTMHQGVLSCPTEDFAEELEEVLRKYDIVLSHIKSYLNNRPHEILAGYKGKETVPSNLISRS